MPPVEHSLPKEYGVLKKAPSNNPVMSGQHTNLADRTRAFRLTRDSKTKYDQTNPVTCKVIMGARAIGQMLSTYPSITWEAWFLQ